MNIFVLDLDPKLAAQYQANIHVNKMLIESCQLLCAALHMFGYKAPYKPTHKNHPCAIWVRESRSNYLWLLEHGKALSEEYTYRYKKSHACNRVLKEAEYAIDQIGIPNVGLTKFAQCIPDEYKRADVVQAYRNAYRGTKSHIAKWSVREVPFWF
jgi:hypothetical protein